MQAGDNADRAKHNVAVKMQGLANLTIFPVCQTKLAVRQFFDCTVNTYNRNRK